MMNRARFIRLLLSLPFGPALLGRVWGGDTASRHLINKFYIAGFRYYEGPVLIERMEPGESLRLVADPGNPYDKFAVEIHYRGRKLGYVPRTDNKHISRLLRQDIPLVCELTEAEPERETWKMARVSVFL